MSACGRGTVNKKCIKAWKGATLKAKSVLCVYDVRMRMYSSAEWTSDGVQSQLLTQDVLEAGVCCPA